jgi:hypothetical protein
MYRPASVISEHKRRPGQAVFLGLVIQPRRLVTIQVYRQNENNIISYCSTI